MQSTICDVPRFLLLIDLRVWGNAFIYKRHVCGVLKDRTQTRRKRRCYIVKRKTWVPHSEKRKENRIVAFEKDNLCVWEQRKIRKIFFSPFSHEIYTRIIVIDFIIVKLFRVCFVVFSLQRERIFQVNICVIVCDF